MKTRSLPRFSYGILLLLAIVQTRALAEQLRPLSATGLSSAAAASGSYSPAFSSGGRFIVFVSHANNLVTNDDLAPYLDVFVRDLATTQTTFVSVNRTGIGGGNADANFPSISSNGQFVAFASAAGNLVNNDTNDASDIFVRDLVAGVTTLVSVDTTGTSSAGVLSPWTRYRLCSNPLISADGRRVVFESFATNLVALTDTNQLSDIFARDLQSGTTLLVSANASGASSGNGNSDSPALTADGRFVAFVSTSTDLVPGTTNQLGDIYLRDLQASATAWVSQNAGNFFTNSYRCFNPALSADGRVVAFKANSPTAPNTVLLIRHDVQTGTSTVLSSNSSPVSWPQMSTDGRFVASENSNDVYVWDAQTGSNVLVSVNSAGTGPGNKASYSPVMTPDGRRIVFLSTATNLTDDATNGISQVFWRDVVSGTTRLVSATVNGAASAGGIDVTLPAISVDGQQVAFESLASDLATNDLNHTSDIFLRDTVSGLTQLVSARHPDLPETTGSAVATLLRGSMSANGKTLAFASSDGNLVPNDNDAFTDLFVRELTNQTIFRANLQKSNVNSEFALSIEMAMSADGRYFALGTPFALIPTSFSVSENILRTDLLTGTNELVSLRFDGTAAANGVSAAPAISSDGNLVAFHSSAHDVVNGLPTTSSNVFVRDMLLGTNRLVSINLLGTAGANRDSLNPLFSPDDRWVVFTSSASDLSTNSIGGITNLFARDLSSNTTRMISVGPDDSSLLGYLHGATFSADSLHLAFVTTNNSVAVYDFIRGTSAVVCANCDNPSISADGRLVAYETAAPGGSPKEIVMKDAQTGLTNLISVNQLGTGGGDGDSTSPLFSWDGRFVVFASKASDLVDHDTNNVSDIFVRDRLLGTTLLASMNLHGTGSGNSVSSKPMLAADGRTVLFQSFASDLVPGDYNSRRDIFVVHLGGPDTDGDGMDDDWEMAYFGTLARDGTGDFDGDGHTDLDEFLAGTDPTDAGSVLRVLTLSPLGGGAPRLIWSAAPGKAYRVQSKANLEDAAWVDLPGPIIANGTTASFLDTFSAPTNHQFYRVLVAP